MKKISLAVVCNLLIICFCLSCSDVADNSLNFKVSESDNYYKMHTTFNPNRTTDVDRFMNEKFGRENNMSFKNAVIDAQLTFDDHTTFYLKKHPGYVEIKLNKNENSTASYQKIKSMCEGIKKVIMKS